MAGDSSRVPRLVARPDSNLPLSPVDGFVLSRIDGRLSERELATLTGLTTAQVSGSLDKLSSLRVIDFGDSMEPPPRPEHSPSAAPSPSPSPSPFPPLSAAPERLSGPPASPLPPPPRTPAPPPISLPTIADDAPELSELVDLDTPFRKRVLGLYAILNDLDYYEVLGVQRAAEKRAIKRAYFELASRFHPDKYFRKELGSFKLKMETIFGRVTQAYDTLMSKDGRREYDAYLKDLDRTRGVEAMLKEALEEMKRAEEDAQRAAERTSAPPLIDGFAIGPGGGRTPPSVPVSPLPERARRDALAMRLLGGQRPSVRIPAAPTGSTPPKPVEAVDALRRRYEDRISTARKQQADKYLQLAAEAESRNDLVAAANAYKVALSFSGADDALRRKAEVAQAKADELLSDTYLRQATYEEREEHWPEAAVSWRNVVKGRPNDHQALERAANAILRSSGDLHEAVGYAQRAITAQPSNADYRITLATVYLAAGRIAAAKGELEAAAQLSPRNATIQTLLKRVHKAG